ncbi:phosphoglycerate mutase [Reticulibacter mediterranei]|uniref:Phosphoglycerate mutase n=2 Tax=Reticulibacter mediterranei TaxID=2778369 RepID=A0A8J3IQK1_9CHLR|nr:phosphoglycerate mutase [Reticulibacter mediterranei]
MRYLILIRHSQPAIEPEMAGRKWHLSAEGRARCRQLAEQISSYQPSPIVCSTEPKASETAALLSAQLGISYSTNHDLREHERDTVPYLGQEKWERAITEFFTRPDELVLGNETATQALQRFDRAVQKILHQHTEGNIAIVAHGTVITLFLAQHASIEPLPFWHALTLPAFFVVSLPDYVLINAIKALE